VPNCQVRLPPAPFVRAEQGGARGSGKWLDRGRQPGYSVAAHFYFSLYWRKSLWN
jgi:hypothetical protein